MDMEAQVHGRRLKNIGRKRGKMRSLPPVPTRNQ
jgi:hypothetical protein